MKRGLQVSAALRWRGQSLEMGSGGPRSGGRSACSRASTAAVSTCNKRVDCGFKARDGTLGFRDRGQEDPASGGAMPAAAPAPSKTYLC